MKNTSKTLVEAAQSYFADQHFKYDAFISYRHTSPDSEIAKSIHTALETYVFPKELNHIANKHQLRLFRDREELASASLNESLETALHNSRFLIVICSKQTPLSAWCNKEVETFLKIRGPQYIIPILVEGEPSDSYPFALRDVTVTTQDANGDLVELKYEHLAADIRTDFIKSNDFANYANLSGNELKTQTKEAIKLFNQTEKYRVLSAMFGCSMGDLLDRAKQRHNQLVRRGFLALASVFTLVSLIIFNAYQKEQAAKISSQQNQAKILLNLANTTLSNGDKVKGALIAEYALQGIDPNYPKYQDLKQQQLSLYQDALYNPDISIKTIIHNDNNLAIPDLNHKNTQIASGLSSSDVGVWDLQNGKLLNVYKGHTGLVKNTTFSNDDKMLLSSGMDDQIMVWVEEKSEPIMKRKFESNVLASKFTHDDLAIFTYHLEGPTNVFSLTDIKTGQDMFESFKIEGNVTNISFSPNQYSLLVTLNKQKTILLDFKTGKIHEHFVGFTTTEITIDDDNLWLTKDSAEYAAIPKNTVQHTNYEYAIFSKTGTEMIVLSEGNYHLIDVATNSILATYQIDSTIIFSDLGDFVVPLENIEENSITIINNNLLYVFDRSSGNLIKLVDPSNVFTVADVYDGNRYILFRNLTNNNNIKLIDLESDYSFQIPTLIPEAEAIKFTQDGKMAIVYSRNYKKIWLLDLVPSDNVLRNNQQILASSNNGNYSLVTIDNQLEEQSFSIINNNNQQIETTFSLKDFIQSEYKLNPIGYRLADNGQYLYMLVSEDQTGDTSNLVKYHSIIIDVQAKTIVNSFNYNANSQLLVNFTADSLSVYMRHGNEISVQSTVKSDSVLQVKTSDLSGVLIGMYPINDHVVAFNYLEGYSDIYDLKTHEVIESFVGQIVFAKYQDNNRLHVKGITSKDVFSYTEGQDIKYQPIDSPWSEYSTLGKDIHLYNEKSNTLTTIRGTNSKNYDEVKNIMTIDFNTGKITKRFYSHVSFDYLINFAISENGSMAQFNYNSVFFNVLTSQNPKTSAGFFSHRFNNALTYTFLSPQEINRKIEQYIGNRQLTPDEIKQLGQ